MKLEALPAKKGDCLLLHHGPVDAPRLILIDGGPSGVYRQNLKPRLIGLRQQRIDDGLIGDDDKLFIDLVIVSHIDDDHINGILAMLDDMDDPVHPAPFKIGRLWHNSFDSLVGAEGGQVASLPGHGQEIIAALGGAALSDAAGGDETLEMVIASVGQGYQLLGRAKKLGISLNPEFGGKAIEAKGSGPFDVDGLSMTLLGPRQDELDDLRDDFSDWLDKKAQGIASTASLIASFTDKSVANLSSIAMVVEGEGKRYLLTGDARADKLIEAARLFGLLDPSGKLAVDIFKVPHHGSDRNNDVASFEAFPAKAYVFSGDGEHGNPERETFAYLADARPGVTLDVRLTYSPAEIDQGREEEWDKQRTRNPALPAFDSASQGIVPFLDQHPLFEVSHPG